MSQPQFRKLAWTLWEPETNTVIWQCVLEDLFTETNAELAAKMGAVMTSLFETHEFRKAQINKAVRLKRDGYSLRQIYPLIEPRYKSWPTPDKEKFRGQIKAAVAKRLERGQANEVPGKRKVTKGNRPHLADLFGKG